MSVQSERNNPSIAAMGRTGQESQEDTNVEYTAQHRTSEGARNVPATVTEETIEHSVYYFSLVVFLVDGKLFKVPRIFFEEQSTVFRDWFMLPPGGENSEIIPEGTSDKQPIRLEGVKKDDFAAFLKLLIPLKPWETVDLQKKELIAALALSTMWEFKQIREVAILQLERLLSDVVERIILGQKYDVGAWILPAYTELAKRLLPPTVEEASRLGMEFTFKMIQAREKVIKARAHASGLRDAKARPTGFALFSHDPRPQDVDSEQVGDVNYVAILTGVFGKNLRNFLPNI
ncbi:hypothetical protein BD410DRAFT_774612 [Rickenella mellea]|uniref:BTB domain-containing protein n=1 Tax=Rickenella mellea TaxID=50990 RepID=A0A4Y7PUZ1_9AGAM|nr:hypothetical protein BD410DRAFT_774612 [Rickenella mellea]